MPGHRQPLASPDGKVFSPRCRKDVLCSWHTVLYARFLFCKKRREYIYIYNYPNFFELFFKKLFRNGGLWANLTGRWCVPKRPQRHFVNFFVRANLPLCLAFGTGEGLLWYGRDIRCTKQAPVVRDASSKARRTADSTDCGQPTAAPDASSVRETAPARRWLDLKEGDL